ncbi:MAG: SAM-dependent methyltransferase [Kofleriaceae bacterium]
MPLRVVHHGDGIAFLADRLPDDHAIVTSLPDHSELPALGVPAWRDWFIATVALACHAVGDDAVAMFYQTDVKHDGRWIDKAHLVMCGADAAGSHVLWHKVVCRVPPGLTTFGRPAYAHLVCLSRARRLAPGTSTADVLPALGTMSWSRAMGSAACDAAVRFVASIGARTVVDPFCGHGSILAAANAHGLDAIGVELSRRRARRARSLAHEPPSSAANNPAPTDED